MCITVALFQERLKNFTGVGGAVTSMTNRSGYRGDTEDDPLLLASVCNRIVANRRNRILADGEKRPLLSGIRCRKTNMHYLYRLVKVLAVGLASWPLHYHLHHRCCHLRSEALRPTQMLLVLSSFSLALPGLLLCSSLLESSPLVLPIHHRGTIVYS